MAPKSPPGLCLRRTVSRRELTPLTVGHFKEPPSRGLRVVGSGLRSRFLRNADGVPIEGLAPDEALQASEPPEGAAIGVDRDNAAALSALASVRVCGVTHTLASRAFVDLGRVGGAPNDGGAGIASAGPDALGRLLGLPLST